MEEAQVPSGWSAIREDFSHFCRVQGAVRWPEKCWVLFSSRSFWGLALYRYGRWAYGLRSRLRSFPFRVAYLLLFEVVRRLTKTSLSVRSHIEAQVWLAPGGELFISRGTRLGRGCLLHGTNTLGVGGRVGNRGHPQVGERVVLAPGASLFGPVEVPAGATVGPNSAVAKSLPNGEAFLGAPAQKRRAQHLPLVPSIRIGRTAPLEEAKRMNVMREPFGTPEPEPFWPAFQADLQRHFIYTPGMRWWQKLGRCLMVDGIWAMAVYRFGRTLLTGSGAWWTKPAWLAYRLLDLWLSVVTGVCIDVRAKIAPGFYVGHFVSLYIGPGVRIGRNCSVSQLCYLAGDGPDGERRAPILGERVYLGAGAKVIGPLHVHNGAAVGANAVVVEDVPENAVVVGNPGVIVSRKGSGDFIYLGQGRAPELAEGPTSKKPTSRIEPANEVRP